MSREQFEGGISFRDVGDYLSDLAARRGGYFAYSIAHKPDRERQGTLSVVLTRYDHIVESERKGIPARVWGYWPDRDCRSFAGLLHKLCYELDRKLGEVEREAQERLPF